MPYGAGLSKGLVLWTRVMVRYSSEGEVGGGDGGVSQRISDSGSMSHCMSDPGGGSWCTSQCMSDPGGGLWCTSGPGM